MSTAAAIRVAARAAEQVGGITVTITRPSTGQTAAEVPVGLGSSPVATIGADGTIVTIKSKDFLIRREEYDFGDGSVEPARGDQLVLCEEDGQHTYELLDLPGEPSYRAADPWGIRWRLHTKEIAKPS